jgi:aldehyde:ferredoxin oxidoreductase
MLLWVLMLLHRYKSTGIQGICLFARGIYTLDVVQRALGAVGIVWTEAELEQLGVETLSRKNAFKQRQGFDFNTLRLPKRMFETPTPAGSFDEEFIRRAIACFARSVGEEQGTIRD